MADTVRKWFYPTEEQWDRWQDEMEARGFETPNQFVQAMVEAGLKEFNAEVKPNKTVEELRDENRQLREQVEELRDHANDLENELVNTDKGVVYRYLHRNPKADYEAVLAQARETAPERVTRYIDEHSGQDMVPKDRDPRADL